MDDVKYLAERKFPAAEVTLLGYHRGGLAAVRIKSKDVTRTVRPEHLFPTPQDAAKHILTRIDVERAELQSKLDDLNEEYSKVWLTAFTTTEKSR